MKIPKRNLITILIFSATQENFHIALINVKYDNLKNHFVESYIHATE